MKALWHSAQITALLIDFGFGHVLSTLPSSSDLSALYFMHSYTT